MWPADLDARYELLEEAGRGGMGVVYKARDCETGELVAIKVLRPEIAVDPVAADRFINEVRLSRRITHKNVCRVYEFSRVGSTAYLSMEYVEGESLRAILARLGAVNVRKGVQIARQICAALAEAHSQGIIHRDLKPENVMIDRSGNVKIMDFGIARLLDSAATQTSGVLGTPAYMAPEQAEAGTVDARTDIYALGLILYEIFTGQTTFKGDSAVAIALKQIRETPATPRSLEPSLPDDIDTIVMRCLEKDPARRYQTIEEVDAALAALPLHHAAHATGQMTPGSAWPSVARPETTPLAPPVHLPARRRTGLVAAAAVAVLAVALVAAYFAFWRTRDEIPFTTFTLANGLQVVVSEDHSAPTVAVVVTYAAGSRDERQGRRGFAHLFEHMMFSGSLNVGKGEHLALVSNYGGVPNGQANYDYTQFWQTLPANQLDLALFLEADRMRSLKLEEARLEAVRRTVLAEIGQQKENTPYGRMMDTLFARAYDTPGYQRDVLGSSDDIRKATLQDVADFFKIYFAPNNAVLTIVGDVDAGDVKARVQNFFEHIPAQPPPPVPDLSEPPQTAERRATLEDPFAPGPRILVAYKGPSGASPDWEPLQLLVTVLGEGFSSRLNQKLVRESEAITTVAGSIHRRTGPGLAVFGLAPAANRDTAAVLGQFDALIKDVVERGISDVELTRAKRRIELSRATLLQTTRDRAALLGEYASRYGDASGVNERGRRLEAVTLDDVNRIAREYLKSERRTIVEAVPTPGARGPSTQPSTDASVGVPSEFLNRAPVAKDILRVSLPKVRDFTLDNGLGVQVAEVDRVPLVTVRFDVRGAGPMYDPPDQPGLAFMTVVMLRSGTANRSSRDIAEELDRLGASVSSGTASDPGSITFSATGLRDTFDQWFPLVADLVAKPSFPGDELVIARRSFATEMAARRSTASAAASDLLATVVTGSEVPIVATPQMIERITTDRITAWHRERFAPQNVVLSIAGAVDAERAEQTVRAALSGWARTSFTESPPAIRPPSTRGVHIMDRPGSVQTALMLGGIAPSRTDRDTLPLTVANMVLGGAQGSRLFRSLREERGISYNAQSSVIAYKHGGFWFVYGDTAVANTGTALQVFSEELRRLGAEPVPAAALDDAKRSIVGRFALTLELLPQLVGYMAIRRGEGLSADYWDRYPDRLRAVTAEDLQRAVAKYIDPSKMQIVAVGSSEQLVPLLTPFGPVTVYDAEGQARTQRSDK